MSNKNEKSFEDVYTEITNSKLPDKLMEIFWYSFKDFLISGDGIFMSGSQTLTVKRTSQILNYYQDKKNFLQIQHEINKYISSNIDEIIKNTILTKKFEFIERLYKKLNYWQKFSGLYDEKYKNFCLDDKNIIHCSLKLLYQEIKKTSVGCEEGKIIVDKILELICDFFSFGKSFSENDIIQDESLNELIRYSLEINDIKIVSYLKYFILKHKIFSDKIKSNKKLNEKISPGKLLILLRGK